MQPPIRALFGLPFSVSLGLGALGLGLVSCAGSGGDGGSFSIVSCSLGCSGAGSGGDGQVSCGIPDVFVNGELRIVFSQPVDPISLSVFTVQVTGTVSGKTPPADRFVDAGDPRVLVYRPKLSFDSAGNPLFGLTSGASYTLKLPGAIEDPGADYVRSTSGSPNRHRMLCTVAASLGVLDAKIGDPTASASVDTVLAYDPVSGEPSEFALGVPAPDAVNVYRHSDIRLSFDDLMNPATLVNPVTAESATIRVSIDPDGDLTDAGDQQQVPGTFSIQLDQDKLVTTVIFRPALGFPSAGSDPVSKRRIVVDLAPTIADLGGNALSNAGEFSFVPEVLLFEEVTMRESFESLLHEDTEAGGADWGEKVFGALLRGQGGGSGQHGALRLRAGDLVTLSTDFEDFSAITNHAIYDPASAIGAAYDGSAFHPPAVEGGIFEFSSLFLETGSRLSFTGTKPARVFVRGRGVVRGVLDVAADDGLAHDTTDFFGGVSQAAGPSGALGGQGGRLPTWVGFEGVGAAVPTDPTILPPTPEELNGLAGEGVPDNLLVPTGVFGGGGGGLAWPQPTAAFPQFHMPVSTSDVLGVDWDILLLCQTKMKASVGAGGAFGLSGGLGLNKPMTGGGLVPPSGPEPGAGSASDFGLGIGSDPDLPQRKLSPEEGWLHGGAGGGGGGSHIATTFTNGKVFENCTVTGSGAGATIQAYGQHSGAAGGAGGGALQLQAGRRVEVDGSIDASGGSGGSKHPVFGHGTSGGGGAGGAILLQSPSVVIGSGFSRLDFRGGAGGFGAGASIGGAGGAGLVRLESDVALDLDVVAARVSPSPAELAAVGAQPADVISIGAHVPLDVGPAARSGAQSCWLRPEGNFFLLTFLEDVVDPVTHAVLEPAWDLGLILNPTLLGEQSFRGENDFFGISFESFLGNELGASPLVVRFQGARAIAEIDTPCDVVLAGPDAEIAPGSLTGWVEHPAELNEFFADPALRPNLIRFQVIFDDSNPFAGLLAAVTELRLRVQPD